MAHENDNTASKQKPNPLNAKCQMLSAPTTETGGPKGPEPTRYGDWEHKGKCVDF